MKRHFLPAGRPMPHPLRAAGCAYPASQTGSPHLAVNRQCQLAHHWRRQQPALHPPSPAVARRNRLEIVLLQAGESLSRKKCMTLAGITNPQHFQQALDDLRECYREDDAPYEIAEIAGGYQLLTQPRYHHWLHRLFPKPEQGTLTPATLETLATIAYHQPIMRAEIDKIRGVSSQDKIQTLLEAGLIKIVGRHDSLGRPALYGTTKWFLEMFGLQSLKQLQANTTGSQSGTTTHTATTGETDE